MTIEKLSKALLDALQAQGAYVGELETPDGSVAIDGEVCPALVVRALLPLIAAELAGVLAAKTRGDVLLAGGEMSASELRTAMAILSWASASILDHARKMGEA